MPPIPVTITPMFREMMLHLHSLPALLRIILILLTTFSFKVKLSDGSINSVPGKYNDKYKAWVGSKVFPNSNRIPTMLL